MSKEQASQKDTIHHNSFHVIKSDSLCRRFEPPKGYVRESIDKNDFGYNLRHFPLYPEGQSVRYFNGEFKSNQSLHAAVLNMDVGAKDLQQCADAIMRLRAEYLFAQKKYDKISFHFVNGFFATYSNWRKGKRIRVKGNNTEWYQTNKPSKTYAAFKQYLEMVFMYAGTSSLENEMIPRPIREIQIGDVFIQGGNPGHAVIVMDVAQHVDSGNKVFMLAQSYMPAQDIHILKNPLDEFLSPWYSVGAIGAELFTPEWHFLPSDLRRFKD